MRIPGHKSQKNRFVGSATKLFAGKRNFFRSLSVWLHAGASVATRLGYSSALAPRARLFVCNRFAIPAVALAIGLASGARGATVPVSESFESYANGYDITNAAAWSGTAGAGIVTNDAAAIGALAAYTNAGGVFPLPDATHDKVLQISDALTNSVQSATGGVVVTDMLLMPAQRDEAPVGSTNYHLAYYVNSNDQLVVWHRGASSNEWLTLANSPTMATGIWYRVTVRKAYAFQRYQISINNGAPIEDSLGWSSADGGSHPGSWFDMVQTDRNYLTRLRTEGEKTAYLDDIIFTNRSVSFSGTPFIESATNDGSITTIATITLANDTFVNTTYSAGTHFSTSGVPAGLTVALAYESPTTVTVSLTGTAAAHAAADSTGTMEITLEDEIFTLGNAADVTGYTRSDLAVDFDDPPVLAYTTDGFLEGVSNNGSIANSITITLTGDTFTNTTPLLAGTHYTVSGVPAGLTAVVVRDDDTTLTLSLAGNANNHAASASTSMTLTFLNAAFGAVGAANITGSTKSLAIDFADVPTLTYSATTYAETAANDGSLSGGTISLSGDTFAGDVGTNYVAGGAVMVNNLPAGLTASIVKTAMDEVTVSFTGKATAHADANGVNNLTFAFQNAAFIGNNAAAITGATKANLVVDFSNPPLVSYSGTTFSEATGNNGTIANSLALTLAGETFADDGGFGAGDEYTVDNVPTGLTLVVTRNSATQLTLALTGTATSHASANDVANLTFALQDAAFSAVAAANITGATRSDLVIDFNDQPAISYSATVFNELSGGQIDNTAPIQITIIGDTFTGANGSDFVAGGKVTPANVPAGLTLVLTRSSSTKLLATLTGTATAHASVNSISNLTITFQNTAFAADANQVTGYTRSDLEIGYNDSTLTINTVPYSESFESYANGHLMARADGWNPESAGSVTSETAIVSALTGSFSEFPLETTHAKVLRITAAEISSEIKSGAGSMVYSDMMVYIVGREDAPAGSADYQVAIFVDTNQALNVWHRDTSGTPATNTWQSLSGVTVATGAWHRVSVEKDYVAQKFRLYLDGSGVPVNNPTSQDAWFNMVGTANTYLSRFRLLGGDANAPTYLDDLHVDILKPAFLLGQPSVFRFR